MQLSPWQLAVKKKPQLKPQLQSSLQHQLLTLLLQPLHLLLTLLLQLLLLLQPSNTSLIKKSRFRAAFFRLDFSNLSGSIKPV